MLENFFVTAVAVSELQPISQYTCYPAKVVLWQNIGQLKWEGWAYLEALTTQKEPAELPAEDMILVLVVSIWMMNQSTQEDVERSLHLAQSCSQEEVVTRSFLNIRMPQVKTYLKKASWLSACDKLDMHICFV